MPLYGVGVLQMLYLQCIAGRFVPAELVGDSGEQTVVGHYRLRNHRNIPSVKYLFIYLFIFV